MIGANVAASNELSFNVIPLQSRILSHILYPPHLGQLERERRIVGSQDEDAAVEARAGKHSLGFNPRGIEHQLVALEPSPSSSVLQRQELSVRCCTKYCAALYLVTCLIKISV